MPINLLLGRAMLLTRPSFTGSWLAMKTVGIVVVAALAAKGPRVHRGRVTELSSRQCPLCRGRPQCGLDFSPLGCRRQSQHQIDVSSWLMSAYVAHSDHSHGRRSRVRIMEGHLTCQEVFRIWPR